MSWRDNFNPIAKFRDAEFVITSSTMRFGRKTVTHEYPLRDEPYTEDLGLKAREFSVTGFVSGDNYHIARDALIKALETPGAGTLIHPYLGTMQVNVNGDAQKTERSTKGGWCEFTIPFVQAGKNTYPKLQIDTSEVVLQKSFIAQKTILGDFSDVFSSVGLIDSDLSELTGNIGQVLTTLETSFNEFIDLDQVLTTVKSSLNGIVDLNTLENIGDIVDIDKLLPTIGVDLDGFIDPLASIIRSPYNLGSAVIGTFIDLKGKITEPLQAIKLYSKLFNIGLDDDNDTNISVGLANQTANHSTASNLTSTTDSKFIRVASIKAFNDLTRTNALISAAQSSSQVDYESYDDAVNIRDQLLAQFDVELEREISDQVYRDLTDLRIAVINDIKVRGADLSRLTTYTPNTTLPALVIAHLLYGDASRENELINRNNITHPAFVSGGYPLEVLDV